MLLHAQNRFSISWQLAYSADETRRALEQLKEMWDNAPTSSALNGALDASRSGTSMGNAGYRLNADVVEAHTKKP